MAEARSIRGWRSGILPLLLSLLLAFEVGSAFFPRVEAGQGGIAVELCSEFGVRTVVLDPDTGQPVEPEIGKGHCPLCVISVAFLASAPAPVAFAANVERAPRETRALVFPPAAPIAVPGIRGPPLTV